MIIQDFEIFGLFAGYFFLIIIIFVINIAICVWVYRDAHKYGKDPTLWLIIVLVGGCVGLIVYLILRDR